MNDPIPVPLPVKVSLTISEWMAIASLLFSVGSLVFTGGFLWGQVQNNTRRISLMEPKVDAVAAKIERIDANVEWLRQEAQRH